MSVENPTESPGDKASFKDRIKKIGEKIPDILSFVKQDKDLEALVQEPSVSILEIRKYWLDAIENALRPHRQRTQTLPFNRVTVHLLATQPDHQQKYLAALEHLTPSFESAVFERLKSARYSLPDDFSVDAVVYTEIHIGIEALFQEHPIYVHLELLKASEEVQIQIVKGKAQKDTYVLSSEKVHTIGRLEIVENERGHLIRTNTIAFAHPLALPETDSNRSINDTISRIHGKIYYHRQKRKFVYENEHGSTNFFRESMGNIKSLKKNQTVTLEAGDLLYLGKGCIQFLG